MSHENVEVVRGAAQAWNAGDMDAFRELHDPDVVLRPDKNWPEPGPYTGREAVMRFYERVRETWDADTLDEIGDFPHAADRVVGRWAWHGQGHACFKDGADGHLHGSQRQSSRGRILL